MKAVNKYKICFVFILFFFFVSLIFTGTSRAFDPWLWGYSNGYYSPQRVGGYSNGYYSPQRVGDYSNGYYSPQSVGDYSNGYYTPQSGDFSNDYQSVVWGSPSNYVISWGPISVQNNTYSRAYTTPGGGYGVSYGPAFGLPQPETVEDEVAFFDEIASFAADLGPEAFYAASAAAWIWTE